MQYNDIGTALNVLAREQMKKRILADILCDIQACEIEGFDYKEYLQDLKNMIDGLLEEKND